jgi:uncharacterized protein YggT (Ycf19 family)
MSDRKAESDEARRASQHEQVKSHIESDVGAEIAAGADRVTEDRARVEQVASKLRGKAIHEVEGTEAEVERARATARVSQVVDYVFYLIYGLLGIRFVLALLAARPGAGFYQFIQSVTDPLYAPFRGILPGLTTTGGSTVASSVAFAIGIYILLHLAVKGLLRLIAHRRTAV